MFRVNVAESVTARPIPRVSGGVPNPGQSVATLFRYSPRKRGCSRQAHYSIAEGAIPRVRGGVPSNGRESGRRGHYSPRTRGCSPHDSSPPRQLHAIPRIRGDAILIYLPPHCCLQGVLNYESWLAVKDHFWAKSDPSDPGKWLSLPRHARDTALTANQLSNKFKIPAPDDYFQFLASIHDVGKIHWDFSMRPDVHSNIRDRVGSCGLTPGIMESARHEIDSAVYFMEWAARRDIPITQAIPAAATIGSHHGITHTMTSLAARKRKLLSERGKMWMDVALDLIEDMYNLAGRPEISPISPALFPTITGYIILADWMASDSFYYPLADFGKDRVEPTKSHTLPTRWNAPVGSPFDFLDISPTPVQKAVTEKLSGKAGYFTILEAPTGTGKTEAALALAHNVQDSPGLVFCLPTQATTNAMAARTKDWVAKVGGESVVIHGSAPDTQSFPPLLRRAKTRLMMPIALTTVDQVMMSAAPTKHVHIRHAALAGKVIILDEIHSWSPSMEAYGYKMLTWLSNMGCTVIGLSATLSSRQRADLVSAWNAGKSESPLEVSDTTYPMLTTVIDGDVMYEELPSVDESRVRDIRVSCRNDPKIPETGIVLRVCSTVAQAQEMYDSLDRNDKILLHSRFSQGDRARNESDLVSQLGPDGNRPKSLVVIATQVVESSLDIDADILITDIAPLDSIIQRAGRLHRHPGRERPEGMEAPRIIIDADTNNARKVYGMSAVQRVLSVFPEGKFENFALNEPYDIPRLINNSSLEGAVNTHQVEGWDDLIESEAKAVYYERKNAASLTVSKPGKPFKFMEILAESDARVEVRIRGEFSSIQAVIRQDGELVSADYDSSETSVPLWWLGLDDTDEANLKKWIEEHTDTEERIILDTPAPVKGGTITYDYELGLVKEAE